MDAVATRRLDWLRVNSESAPVQPPVGAALPEAGFPTLPGACAELLEPTHAARAQAIYDECLVAAFDGLPYDRPLDQAHVDGALRAGLARTPDLRAVALALHALRAAGILRGYDITVVGDALGGVAFDDLLTADRPDQLGRLLSAEQAAAGVLAGLAGGWSPSPLLAPDGGWVELEGVRQQVGDRVAPLLRAWARASPGPLPRLAAAPRRPVDARHHQFWRTPPAERVRLEFRAIECRAFRLMGNPPMDWTRPPRSSRNGLLRSPRPC